MNIVVMNGSPNAGGNTDFLVNGFCQGAREAGNHVSVFRLSEMGLCGCSGCNACKTAPDRQCIHQDDMADLQKAAGQAEMIVFASPIFFFAPSSWLQMGIERFHNTGFPKSLKKAALILSSGGDGVYGAALAQFRDMTGYFRLQTMGILTAYGSQNKSQEKQKEAFALGQSIQS